MPHTPPHRPAMVATSIRSAVAPVLKMCPPECGIVSITKVRVSPDLGYVTMHVSALKEPAVALEFLKEHIPEMRKKLAALELRRIPVLRFRMEDQKLNRLDELLQ